MSLLATLRSYWVFVWTQRLGLRRPLPSTAGNHDAHLRQLADQAEQHWHEVEAKIHMYREEAKISTTRAQRILGQQGQ